MVLCCADGSLDSSRCMIWSTLCCKRLRYSNKREDVANRRRRTRWTKNLIEKAARRRGVSKAQVASAKPSPPLIGCRTTACFFSTENTCNNARGRGNSPSTSASRHAYRSVINRSHNGLRDLYDPEKYPGRSCVRRFLTLSDPTLHRSSPTRPRAESESFDSSI